MVRPDCCRDKMDMEESAWNGERTRKTRPHLLNNGKGNWTGTSKKGGIGRCRKGCRLRKSADHLEPDYENDNFTPEEEELIIRLHAAIGSRWFIIAQQLPGRTDADIKNLWNSKLKKKLTAKGIDPVTHKPFSQILANYGTISGFQKARSRFSSLNRDLKDAFMSRSEQSRGSPEGVTHFDSHFGSASPPNSGQFQEYMWGKNQEDSIKSEPIDLLSELQSVALVTEASNFISPESTLPFSMNECSSSSASSASPMNEIKESTASFQWSDFLLQEELPPENSEELGNFLSSRGNKSSGEANFQSIADVAAHNIPLNQFEASTSYTNTAFLQAMLDHEREIFMDFPGLTEEPFYN